LALRQNYPNPLTDRTSIGFKLPRPEKVSLAIFDVRGRVVRTLADGALPAGVYEVSWDGFDHAGSRVASGLYLVQLKGESFRATRKLVVSR
jgi:flagellar hook assembly protein FlgD